jgi:hypothetical protein
VGADWPGEASEPTDGDPGPRGSRGGGDRAAPAETRSRQEYYVELRRTVSAEQSATARQNTAEERAQAQKWDKAAEESRSMWGEYQRRWPPDERPPPDTSADPPGSWRADRDRYLGRADNARIEAACDRIAERERNKISPALRRVESQDPDRHLTGFGNCLKGRDRIKSKVCDKMQEFVDLSPEKAVSTVSDTIRYTFGYPETHYTQGVWSDIERLKDQGFELHKLKNYWSGEEYKGVNSQWTEPDSGQRFEVQFHTRTSFEAKQLTHDAYERLRTHQADNFEQLVLEAFQRKVVAEVPIPPGAVDIPNYPERGPDAR